MNALPLATLGLTPQLFLEQKRELHASVPSSEFMSDARHASGGTRGRGLISCVSLTVPSGKPRAALAWPHVIPIGSSPPHVRPNCAARSPDPMLSHFCHIRLCADIFIIKKPITL